MGQKIAVVGAGVAGLTAAYRLADRHQVTLFEANNYLGGHTHTHEIEVDNEPLRVDTGFIVYNERTYPRFIALLDELGCRGQITEMSFSVRDPVSGLEYNGHNLDTLFSQRRNIFNPLFLRMIRDILRFNRQLAEVSVDDPRDLATYLDDEGYSAVFRDRYIVPMAAAIWSTGDQGITAFPVTTLARFFVNHGLLALRHRPRWYVVRGGSDRYVAAIRDKLDRVRLASPVQQISREPDQVIVSTAGSTERFDQVVIAAHSDQALSLLADATPLEREILGAIRYTPNRACLHTDESVMPLSRRAWASWNYTIDPAQPDAATLTYYMNRLQHLPTRTPLLVTLNDRGSIDPARVIKNMDYEHPFFDRAATRAQSRRSEISGHNRTWYAGAYWRYGFHEDGVMSGEQVAEQIDQVRSQCRA